MRSSIIKFFLVVSLSEAYSPQILRRRFLELAVIPPATAGILAAVKATTPAAAAELCPSDEPPKGAKGCDDDYDAEFAAAMRAMQTQKQKEAGNKATPVGSGISDLQKAMMSAEDIPGADPRAHGLPPVRDV